MTTLPELQTYKKQQNRFACLSLYDATMANLAEKAGVELLLIGDSLGMVISNYPSTLRVDMQTMIYHTKAVAAGATKSVVMSDMPFASYTTSQQAVKNAAKLMRAGAHIVKLEGGESLSEKIKILKDAGIPVCAHLGLTPQFIHLFGGYKVQGREPEQADKIYETCMKLCEDGADMLLLECIPSRLAKLISEESPVPVIGIGAGWDTDAQILVAHDALGMNLGKTPGFVKNFLESNNSVKGAFEQYVREVKNMDFPSPEHSY